jgi:hypothetical protein
MEHFARKEKLNLQCSQQDTDVPQINITVLFTLTLFALMYDHVAGGHM